MSRNMQCLGVDTGGTFTDFIYFDGQQIHTAKVLSTPANPEKAVIAGCQLFDLDYAQLAIVHGSTVATNAVLEGKGVKTVYISNTGFSDLLTIARQARSKLYELQPASKKPPVSRQLCLGVSARVDAQGNVLQQVNESDLQAISKLIEREKPEAVAINLLFSFLNDESEHLIKQHLPSGVFVSCSSQVLSEIKEYERGIATWLNAWVGPLIQNYLQHLTVAIKPRSLHIMQSSGGTADVKYAGDFAVNLLLSGPAAGLKGAQYMASLSGFDKVISLDMGGTSTDVALIDQQIKLSSESTIAEYPVAVPMVDMHTIGAGGGSIARVDDGGLLQLGPESAGANPGPACYGLGGQYATVTDANLILHRIPSSVSLAGSMALDVQAAYQVFEGLAQRLNTTVVKAAQGVVELANAHMSRALRLISVERGYYPADFTLLSFGGAGGLHVCALAKALGMQRILIPEYSGVLSALGMLVSARATDYSHTVMYKLANLDSVSLMSELAKLEQTAKNRFLQTVKSDMAVETKFSIDVRYIGQSFTLNIVLSDLASMSNPAWISQQFHHLHKKRYGHSLKQAMEIVNLRVHLQIPESAIDISQALIHQQQKRQLNNKSANLPANRIIKRNDLQLQQPYHGPFIIVDKLATAYVAADWVANLDKYGNLLLTMKN